LSITAKSISVTATMSKAPRGLRPGSVKGDARKSSSK
jgi:hypothetical protein